MLIPWSNIRLVAFDVDGTLYSQGQLRPRMLRLLIEHCVRRGDFRTPLVLSAFRRRREDFAEREVQAFKQQLLLDVATQFRMPVEKVEALVQEWIHEKPLPLLKRCRLPGVDTFMQQIRASGRMLGVLSDYPAADKLTALGLDADFVVSAEDVAVQRMKPHPRGLEHLMDIAGVAPTETILIGDRAERDGAAGMRCGVQTYIRSRKALAGWNCFMSYTELIDANRSALAPNVAEAA